MSMEYIGVGRIQLTSHSTQPPQQNHKLISAYVSFLVYDYSSGVWQFQGYGFVPNGTSGTAIMQIHHTTYGATVLMLMVVHDQLKFYHSTVVESNIYDRWMRLNVIHDVDANKKTVFIDGVKKLQTEGNVPYTYYFKCGVYAQGDEAHCCSEELHRHRICLYKNGE
ncbi:citrate-binding protein-like [Asparagus officinalis]|uniref:citrate-binding protein-like n=1 Tax=Asparagus officinalis TaxID=4686 RepID=UPI00098E62F7|nr:citrate-binding protein-like [Asparagus officinalis]